MRFFSPFESYLLSILNHLLKVQCLFDLQFYLTIIPITFKRIRFTRDNVLFFKCPYLLCFCIPFFQVSNFSVITVQCLLCIPCFCTSLFQVSNFSFIIMVQCLLYIPCFYIALFQVSIFSVIIMVQCPYSIHCLCIPFFSNFKVIMILFLLYIQNKMV